MNGIYVHIPFCLKKCKYCDFVSFDNSYDKISEYIDAVILEMEEYKGEKADTVYIGGGTPTSIPRNLLILLIDKIKENFSLTPDCEITVECNPKTADLDYFKALKASEVNRLSVGIQSMKDDELSFLGRVHTSIDCRNCIDMIKEAGFSNFNVDLMFGVFNQTKESVINSLKELISYSPAHFSCYSLIVEENTPFGQMQKAGTPLLMDEDGERELYRTITSILKENGYEKYEISNYAKKGYRSKHNTKYWTRSPYIGLGCGAHSFYENKRFENPPQISEYISFVKDKEKRDKDIVTQDDAICEFIFLGLRMTEGISKSEFKKCFGKDIFSLYNSEINELISLGLLIEKGDFLYLSDKGVDVSNEVFVRFLN